SAEDVRICVDWFVEALRHNPELAIFLTLALGFFVGRLKIGGFSLGTVVGTLLAGVVVGPRDVCVPAVVKAGFFGLVLFTTGYKVGPQFFRALKKDAFSQVSLTVVLCVTCLVTAFAAAKLLGYDMGTAAGLLAGSFSESTVIGTAGEAINRLAISAEEKARLVNNIPIAYAVTYLIGTAGLGWVLPVIGPKLIGVNLKAEGKRAQAAAVGTAGSEPWVTSAARRFDVRAYRVASEHLAGKTVTDIEALPREARVFILRIRRHGEIVHALPTTALRWDDVIVVAARHEVLVEHGAKIGPEVEDRVLLDIPVETLDVVVTDKTLAGRPLAELGRLELARGVFLKKLVRSGEEMPIVPEARIGRGDVVTLVGTKAEVERASRALGYPDWPTNTTDMIFVGTGIVLGGLFGLLSVTLAGVPLTLTASGGALIMGLVF